MSKQKKMNSSISFLLGSGFSVADGMPLVSDINRKLLELEDIYIHSDMNAMLVSDFNKNTYRGLWKDESFFIKFIQYYSKKILSDSSQFNYEMFFDFINEFLDYGKHSDEIKTFCDNFRQTILKESETRFDDDNNLVFRFKIYFNKIVSSFFQVAKYYEDVSSDYYPPYNDFTRFLIEQLNKNKSIRVHTLNHDLLFEHLAAKNNFLSNNFTDGFGDINSPYYGELYTNEKIKKKYKVRLRRFQDNFEKLLALFKLHGSIDTYIADISSTDKIRIKREYGVSTIIQEIFNETTEDFSYKHIIQDNFPDFLSGTTSKIMQYKNPYYNNLLTKFKHNLKDSNLFYVIGYGFKDEGINDILIENYLSQGKKMVVINRSSISSRLINDYNVEFIKKSFSEVTFDDYLKFVH